MQIDPTASDQERWDAIEPASDRTMLALQYLTALVAAAAAAFLGLVR